jgi:ankyrin repeat protein
MPHWKTAAIIEIGSCLLLIAVSVGVSAAPRHEAARPGHATRSAVRQRTLDADLIAAVKAGKIENVRSLLARGANVNAREDHGWNALVLAIDGGQRPGVAVPAQYTRIASFLIDHGASVKTDARTTSPLIMAITRGNKSLVERLLRNGADPRACDIEGVTPLAATARQGDNTLPSVLIKAGADVNAKGDDGMTPLMWAASAVDNVEAARTFLRLGADVNAQDNDGDTALMVQVGLSGVEPPNPEAIHLLLSHGAKLNMRNKKRETALMRAIQGAYANTELIGMLLDKGADIDARTRDGKTVVDYARVRNRTDLLRFILKRGFHLSILPRNEALGVAAEGGDLKAVKALMNAGADVNATLSDGDTPLLRAALLGGSGEGYSPLIVALRTGKAAVARYLLEHGADGRATDRDRHTALYRAAATAQWEIVRALDSNGVEFDKYGSEATEALRMLAAVYNRRNAPTGLRYYDPVDPLVASDAEIAACTRYLLGHGARPEQRHGPMSR